MTLKKYTGCVGLAALLALGACGEKAGNDAAPTTEAATDAAGKATISTGLGDATKFTAAAKAAGLDGRPAPAPIRCWCPATPHSTSFRPARSTR